MFQDVYSGWLYARSELLSEVTVTELTIILPTRTGLRAFAEISLTSMSQGIDLDRRGVGTIGTRVARGTVMGSSGIAYVDQPADPAFNHAYFNKCLAVDFRLTSVLAEAYAKASVWFHAPPTVKAITIVQKVATVFDKKSSKIRYSQHIVGPVKYVPSDTELNKRAIARAAKLDARAQSKFEVRLEDSLRVKELGRAVQRKGRGKVVVGRVKP